MTESFILKSFSKVITTAISSSLTSPELHDKIPSVGILVNVSISLFASFSGNSENYLFFPKSIFSNSSAKQILGKTKNPANQISVKILKIAFL